MLRGALKPVAVTLLAFGILSTIPSNVGSSYTLKGCCTHINEINLPVHLFFLVWLLTACLFVFHVGWLTRSCILSQRHSRACRAAPAVKRMFTCFAKKRKTKRCCKGIFGSFRYVLRWACQMQEELIALRLTRTQSYRTHAFRLAVCLRMAFLVGALWAS